MPYDNVYGEVQRYLAEAAEQGHPQACCELGLHLVYYETNRAEEGVKYLRNAADCNVKDAMSALAECCARGVGTPRNLEEAERWYCKAAAQGREAQRKREEEARRRQAEEARRLQMELEAKARQWDPLEGPLLAFLTWPVLGFPIGWILSQTHWAVTRQVLAWPFLTPMLWRLRWLHPFLVWVVWAALLAFGLSLIHISEPTRP